MKPNLKDSSSIEEEDEYEEHDEDLRFWRNWRRRRREEPTEYLKKKRRDAGWAIWLEKNVGWSDEEEHQWRKTQKNKNRCKEELGK